MTTKQEVESLRRRADSLESIGKLADKLIAMKESGSASDDPKFRKVKDDLRAARRKFREELAADEAVVAVTPDAVKATATVQEV